MQTVLFNTAGRKPSVFQKRRGGVSISLNNLDPSGSGWQQHPVIGSWSSLTGDKQITVQNSEKCPTAERAEEPRRWLGLRTEPRTGLEARRWQPYHRTLLESGQQLIQRDLSTFSCLRSLSSIPHVGLCANYIPEGRKSQMHVIATTVHQTKRRT